MPSRSPASSRRPPMAPFLRGCRVARALLTTYYAYMLEYRAELLLWALSGTLPFIMMGLWVEASAGGQFGLQPLDFARYFLAAFLARQFNVVWVIWEFEKDVVQGRLSPRLLQPLDPLWHHFAAHLAERLARLPLVVGLVAVFFALYPQAFWVPSWQGALGFAIAVLLAFCLRFLMQSTFALMAFWTERASAIEQFWFLLYLFLSGAIAPLTVFPPAVQAAVQWLPFPYFIYFPAALLVGLPANWMQAIAMLSLWGAAFFALNRWLWRRGLRQYSGMGA